MNVVEERKNGLFTRTGKSYEEVLASVKAALKDEGFGVLTEIDVKETLKQKLGVDFRRYDIIGACNPPMAHQALETELDVGLLLPCNVIVYDDDDDCVIASLDPGAMVSFTGNPRLDRLAADARSRLQRALASAA